MPTQRTIKDNHAMRRYEIRLDDVVAGYINYELRQGLMVLTETVVEPRFRGQGVGSDLVAGTLADAERRGLKISPRCPFVQDYIRAEPDGGAEAKLEPVFGSDHARS